MPTTFIPALNQARPIDWPYAMVRENTDPVSLSKKKEKEFEKEITFTAQGKKKG